MSEANNEMRKNVRADFEAWCDREGINPEKSALTGIYSFPSARVAWRAWKAANSVALEAAASAIEQHDKSGREWVRGSLWDTLARECASRIRSLAEGNHATIDVHQQEPQ